MRKAQYTNLTLVFLIFLVLITYAAYIEAATIRPNTVEQIDFFGSSPYKTYATIRESAILTNSYVDTDVLKTEQLSKIAILFDLTQGSLTSAQYQIWISFDNVNWFVEATETVGAGTITDTPSNGTVTLATDVKYFKILNLYAPYLKLSIKGTGTVTNSAAIIHIVGVI